MTPEGTVPIHEGHIPMMPENIVSKECYDHLIRKRIDLKHSERMLKSMRIILANGDKIAIATFSRYPGVVRLYLERLGLTEDELKDIIIQHGLPLDGGVAHGKNQHIEEIVEKIKAQNPEITIGTKTLVDDSPHNFSKAREKGYKAIIVPQNNTDTAFLEEMEKEIANQAEEEARAQGSFRGASSSSSDPDARRLLRRTDTRAPATATAHVPAEDDVEPGWCCTRRDGPVQRILARIGLGSSSGATAERAVKSGWTSRTRRDDGPLDRIGMGPSSGATR